MQTARSDAAAVRDREPILIDLALPGGGSHGAFTWLAHERLWRNFWRRVSEAAPTGQPQATVPMPTTTFKLIPGGGQ